ncbi:hypothetical protein [Fodinibius sediminis]|uniref:SMODS and SLOG-associating 2TM effector domain-containing protein n=1 Tax=Fodinibius sediminis TaxID=1214077 RepID=A0A521CIA1_9BACT|nr:hypothetical protein [Fodinibius sediminis]SMO58471.1 hypothetical protein SAMN06265218_10654 [Fodinibius sediminis]
MKNAGNTVNTRTLPDDIRERCREGYYHFKFWRRFHYAIGTLGAAVSAIAATDITIFGYSSTPLLAAAAAVCFAIIGFAHPERNYLQYVRAWRILDIACKRYQYDDQFSMKHLLDAIEQGEKLISEYELITEGNSETTLRKERK